MPIYEFRCSACDREFETLTSLSRIDEAACPHCGAGQPRRLMSVIAGMGGRQPDPPPACGSGACARCS